MPGSGRNANRARGGASELSEALDAARRSKKPVPVDALQSETEEFIANPDGTVTREIAQSPVRVKAGDDWVDVDPGLRRAGGRLKPKASADEVTFSEDGDGPLAELKIGKNRISLSMPETDLQPPTVEGAQATYSLSGEGSAAANEPNASTESEPRADPDSETDPTPSTARETVGEKVLVAVKNGGFAAHVLLDATPTQAPVYVFDLTTGDLTPELTDNRLVLRDADGERVAQSMPLRMWDAQVDEAGDPSNVTDVDASLDRTSEGWRLALTPSMDFLTADDTQYPVVVDPDIAAVTNRGDVFFRDGTAANTNFSSEPRVEVGRDAGALNRGFFAFSFNPYLGATVTNAELRLHQYFARDCTPRQLNLHSMTSADRTGATWNTQPNHTTDARFSASKSFSRGATGCGAGTETIDVTNIVNGWAGRHVGTHSGPFGDRAVVNNRQAFIARAADESSTAFYKRFCSEEWSTTVASCSTSAVVPRLSVTFEPEIGEQSWYSMTERELDDRATLKVNNKNANLVLQSADMNVKGLGLDLAINRTYNSQSTETGPMGRGWSLNIGPDIWLEKKSPYRYDFHTPGGTILGSFVRRSADSSSGDYKKFSPPVGGIGSELEETDNGFTLTFRQSQEKYAFNQVNSDGHAFMTKIRDRSDNEITVAYSGAAGTKPRITTITDSADRVYTPTYTGNLITRWATQSLTGVGVRQVNYTYDGDYLTSATDATNARTDYAYTNPSAGTRLLSTITAAANQSGARPTTHITYSNGDGQVATVGYRHGNGTGDVYTYSWNLNSSRVAACDGNGDTSTQVTDPRNNTTTYCYTGRNNTSGDSTTWVYDALGNARSQDYSADNQPITGTNSTGQGVANGSTVATYNNDIDDQLTQITAPRSDGASSGETSKMTYSGNADKPGGNYLPNTVKSGSDDCNRYGYDDKGRTTEAFSGLTANAAGDCPTTGGRGFKRDYNDNGTLAKSWDANAGTNPTDDDKTIYTYWQTGDTGFVAGTKGQVKTIRKPGGNCTTGTSRRLCTSFVYDGASRVTQVTDGRGIITRYAYDANDRTAAVYFNDTTGAQCGGGGITSPNCISYAYDNAGNLIFRTEDAGQTSWGYDRLNRQIGHSTPESFPLGMDRIDYAYDAANNLIGYSQTFYLQSADVTTYTYDAANRPSTVTSAVGTFQLDNDDDGRLEGITFPNPNNSFGLDLSYSYTKSGKPTELDWRFAGNTRAVTWTYDYKRNGADNSRMQSRKLDVNGANAQAGTTTYTYNDERLQRAQRTGSSAAYDYQYTYDAVGNVRSENANGTTTHYGYNRAGERCWHAPASGTDAQKLSRACAAGPTGATNLTQDAAGNNTGTSSDPIGYNPRSQVSTIAGTTQNYFDQGNDIRRLRGNERQLSGPMGLSATSGNAGTTHYTRAPDGTILAGRFGNISWFYVTEPNGNVAYITDVNGAIVGGYEYNPYGHTTVLDGAGFQPLRWMSMHQDTGTTSGGDQIYKLGARYYQTSGTFTQPDALSGGIGDPRTMTAYNYATGDPVNRQDASGYAACDTNTGYWTPPGCSSSPNGSIQNVGPYAMGDVAGGSCLAALVGFNFTAVGGAVAFTSVPVTNAAGVATGVTLVGGLSTSLYSIRQDC